MPEYRVYPIDTHSRIGAAATVVEVDDDAAALVAAAALAQTGGWFSARSGWEPGSCVARRVVQCTQPPSPFRSTRPRPADRGYPRRQRGWAALIHKFWMVPVGVRQQVKAVAVGNAYFGPNRPNRALVSGTSAALRRHFSASSRRRPLRRVTYACPCNGSSLPATLLLGFDVIKYIGHHATVGLLADNAP